MSRPQRLFDSVHRRLCVGVARCVLVVGLAVAGLGCVGPAVSEAEWETRTMRLLQGRKAASQAVVDGDFIANVPADRYVNARTPLLLGGDGRVTTRLSPNGRTAIVGWEIRPGRGGEGGVSSATAITPDGYYLTASHAIGGARLQLVRPGRNGPEVVRARVVWKGDPAQGGPDLALIHARGQDQFFFPLAEVPDRPGRTRVWTGGFGDIRQNQTRGWLRHVGAWQGAPDGSAWRILEHSAPLMRGDSGGPLVDRAGRVLGINTEFLVQPASLLGIDHLRVYRPTAVAPDPSWLQSLVKRDRRRRGR
ncbi:MAG: serine protease [Verrucomicrobiales bacterium]